MTTTTKRATAPQKGKAETAKAAITKKANPAKKADPRPEHVTKRGRNYGQICLGPCGDWKPLTEYSRKSKARGGESPFGVIRVCKVCLTAQSRARREAKAAEAKKAETKPKAKTTKAASRKS